MNAAVRRLIAALAAGVVAALALVLLRVTPLDGALEAGMSGWVVGCIVYVAATWIGIGRFDGPATRVHATQEDPPPRWVDGLVLAAVAGAFVGVGLLLVGPSSPAASGMVPALLGIAAVAASWFLVHTTFAVRYADQFYDAPDQPGIDFGDPDPHYTPSYLDFAYLSFTLGMTYQVSDTQLRSPRIRRTVLIHCLISYLLGAVVIAMTINMVVTLAGSLGQAG